MNKSRYLCLLLRHRPESKKLILDKEGWCLIDQLCENANFSNDEISEIVASDEKQRYSISPDGTKIRANQGHSISSVKINFKHAVPPVKLYHGTNVFALNFILKQGITSQVRHHVHLSSDVETAIQVGSRRKGELVILEIDTKQMIADNFQFFISENKVWLTEEIPPQYITQLKL